MDLSRPAYTYSYRTPIHARRKKPSGAIVPFPIPSAGRVDFTSVGREYRDGFGDTMRLSHSELTATLHELAANADYMQALTRTLGQLLDSTVDRGTAAEKHIRELETRLDTITKCLNSALAAKANRKNELPPLIRVALEAASVGEQKRWPDDNWPKARAIRSASFKGTRGGGCGSRTGLTRSRHR
jgi:hypothetical protein